ncbi:HAD family hydrolase [Thalassobaculum sp.]|uniref:HAD family hydrolase n=1 Tax=Thalassobaculum sp. TaxID=2022740 RepID=UPI0032EDB5E7
MQTSSNAALPPAILFDLDDTLITAPLHPRAAWQQAIETLPDRPDPFDALAAAVAIHEAARWFWSDPVRHREGRMDIRRARLGIVDRGLRHLGISDAALTERLSDHFTVRRTEETALYPDAVDTLLGLAERGVRLGLITNGSAEAQRAKIVRFDLARHFVHIQIEGELGVGKPEEQAYAHALARLGTTAAETWIVGDNIDWEVVVPQRLGFHAIWRDPVGNGLPAGTTAKPDRIITRLAELLED